MERLEVFKAQLEDQTGLEYRMKRTAVTMRLEKRSPNPEGPGGAGKGAQSLL